MSGFWLQDLIAGEVASGEEDTAGNVLRIFGNPTGFDSMPADQRAFDREFGITRMVVRNDDMLKMLNKPATQMKRVNTALKNLAVKGADDFKVDFHELSSLGFSGEEALARATAMAGRRLNEQVGLLALKYPFSMGAQNSGGWDPIRTAMFQGSEGAKMQKYGRFAEAAMNTGLGVGGAHKKHGKKRRLKHKIKKLKKKLGHHKKESK